MRYIIILTLTVLLFSCRKTTVDDLIKQETENISAFAKLYGYVRFFYPGDEAASTDWNKFAVYGIQKVENAKDNKELKERLKEIFLPVAPLLMIYDKNENTGGKQFIPEDTSGLNVLVNKHYGVGGIGNYNVTNNIYKTVRGINKPENDSDIFSAAQQFPHPGELFTADISPLLAVSMPLALYEDKNGTLPHADSSAAAGFAETVNNSVHESKTAKDNHIKLADIVICWNIFKHFYPYFNESKVDWDAELIPALKEAYKAGTEYDFLNVLRKLTAKLNDGHIRVKHPSDINNGYFPPFCWQWIENRLVITRVFDEAKARLQIGDIVAEINNIPAPDALLEEERYISGATLQWKRNNNDLIGDHISNSLMRLLSGVKDSEIKLEILRDGKTINAEFKRTLNSVNVPDTSIYISEKQPGIFYVDLLRLTEIELLRAVIQLKNAKGIIFNMRGYPAVISSTFLRFLIKSEIQSPVWMIPINLYPNQSKTFFSTSGRWSLEPQQPYLNAKIAFLTDGRTISKAETYMSIVEYYKLGEIIGEPTAGTNGNVNIMNLPGGYEIIWTGMKVLKHDGSQHHGVGIQPTIRVPQTIQAVKEGRDIQLEKAIEVVSK